MEMSEKNKVLDHTPKKSKKRLCQPQKKALKSAKPPGYVVRN
jgi:hypothetical protein